MEKTIIRLRPHHAVMLYRFEDRQPEKEYADNLEEIRARLNSGEREMVQIIMHRDTLCRACSREKDAACKEEEKVLELDRQIAARCGLKSGLWISWEELSGILQNNGY